jgi:hypothetical protein
MIMTWDKNASLQVHGKYSSPPGIKSGHYSQINQKCSNRAIKITRYQDGTAQQLRLRRTMASPWARAAINASDARPLFAQTRALGNPCREHCPGHRP